MDPDLNFEIGSRDSVALAATSSTSSCMRRAVPRLSEFADVGFVSTDATVPDVYKESIHFYKLILAPFLLLVINIATAIRRPYYSRFCHCSIY